MSQTSLLLQSRHPSNLRLPSNMVVSRIYYIFLLLSIFCFLFFPTLFYIYPRSNYLNESRYEILFFVGFIYICIFLFTLGYTCSYYICNPKRRESLFRIPVRRVVILWVGLSVWAVLCGYLLDSAYYFQLA